MFVCVPLNICHIVSSWLCAVGYLFATIVALLFARDFVEGSQANDTLTALLVLFSLCAAVIIGYTRVLRFAPFFAKNNRVSRGGHAEERLGIPHGRKAVRL